MLITLADLSAKYGCFCLDTNFETNKQIQGVDSDSRRIKDGFVFFAIQGNSMDGVSFFKDAASKGALAFAGNMSAYVSFVSIHKHLGRSIPFFFTPDPRECLAKVSSDINRNFPDKMVAVTGTNGKTSVVNFVQQIWLGLGLSAASIGTNGIISSVLNEETGNTTLDPCILHRKLHYLSSKGIDSVSMEASSHGLCQRRLDGLTFAAAALTNIGRDHLDYHLNYPNYIAAKIRLFWDLLSDVGTAVLPSQLLSLCDYKEAFYNAVKARNLKMITYGRDDKQSYDHPSPDHLQLLSSVPKSTDSTEVAFKWRDKSFSFTLPLIGNFQIDNILCAMSLCIACGASFESVCSALSSIKCVEGRMEFVALSSKGGAIYVDYAHTPEGMENALSVLREYTKNRLLVVFGAGGDRDKGKRELMGKVACENADLAIITDDNPRNELPENIRSDIMAGCKNGVNIAGRFQALSYAIENLEEGDILLVAGKGHERRQITGGNVSEFHDPSVIKKIVI